MILLTVRWYLRYNLSFRDLVEMMEERGLLIAHTTIMRWVHQYSPKLDKRIRRRKSKNTKAAKRFFKKALAVCHSTTPRVVTVDKNPAYPLAIEQLKEEKMMPEGIQLRQVKYLSNIVEQDHRFIKKRIRPILGLKSLRTAKRIIAGIEAMHMIKKGQTLQREMSVQNQKEFIHQLFGLIA
ncbi:IS6 family transposase [Peribacillus sp. JNUCC 23]